MKKTSLLLLGLLSLVSCKNEEKTSEKEYKEITGISQDLKPGDNFFRYVNAKWYDTITIPETQAGAGAYMFMNYPQRLRLQGILDSVSQSENAEGSIAQKVGKSGRFLCFRDGYSNYKQKGFRTCKANFE